MIRPALIGLFALASCTGSSDQTLPSSTDTDDSAEPLIRSCDIQVIHSPDVAASQVQIAGSFNDWAPLDLEGPTESGEWSVNLGPLAPGAYPFKYVYGGLWEEAPDNAETHWVDGFENRNLRVGDCSSPSLTVRDASVDGSELTASFVFARSVSEAPIDPDSLVVMVGNVPVAATLDVDSGIIELSVSNLDPGKHTVRIWAADTDGNEVEDQPAFVPLWVGADPADWPGSMMYFAMVDRFRDGGEGNCGNTPNVAPIADYHGGDLLGVRQAIDEGWLDELGADVLWLSPLNENPDGGWLGNDGYNQFAGYHGYWPTAQRQVETCFGDDVAVGEDRLNEVVASAHEHGIKVLLDVALNHVHADHPWVAEHPDRLGFNCVCGADGCGWEEQALTCLFTDYLPDVNYRNHDAVEAMIDDVIWWVKTYDVDGLRIDAAKHMDAVIVRNLRLRLDEMVGPGVEIYLVGETFTSGDGHQDIVDHIGETRLHGQFDFPLYWTIRDAFFWGTSLRDLESKVLYGHAEYADAVHYMSPFAGNHDVARMATAAAGNGAGPFGDTWDRMAQGGDDITETWLINQLSTALAFTLTQPGVPLLYYGDEIGLGGDGDPDNRRLMPDESVFSGNQREMLARVRAIGQARAGSQALRQGQFASQWADDTAMAYVRHTDTDTAVVVVHTGSSPRDIQVPLTVGGLPDGTILVDATNDQRTVTVEASKVTVPLNGMDYAILLTHPGAP